MTFIRGCYKSASISSVINLSLCLVHDLHILESPIVPQIVSGKLYLVFFQFSVLFLEKFNSEDFAQEV